MKSYKFGNLDGVGISLICNVFCKMLSDEMDRVRHFNYNNYEWQIGVDVVRRINNLKMRHPLPIESGPNSILGIEVIQSYAVEPNEIVLCISPSLSGIDEPKEESKNGKVLVGDIISGYRYVDTDEAERIKSITNDEKKRHEKALYRLKNMLNNVYGDSMDALRYAAEAAKFLNFNVKEKEGNIMSTNYNHMFTRTANLHFGFIAEIKDVIFNDPATIVFWNDGTKTIVKADNEPFDPEKGLAMAISKKVLGNQGNYYKTFKKWLPKEDKNDKKLEEDNDLIEILTAKQLAEKIGSSVSTVLRDCRRGLHPGAMKVDGKWLIPFSCLKKGE